jgi:hypothetical protein
LATSARIALTIGKVVFWGVAALEVWLLLGLAYFSLNPDLLDPLDESDDSADILAAIAFSAIAIVFGLGVLATGLSRLPLRKAVLWASALAVVVFNLYVVTYMVASAV